MCHSILLLKQAEVAFKFLCIIAWLLFNETCVYDASTLCFYGLHKGGDIEHWHRSYRKVGRHTCPFIGMKHWSASASKFIRETRAAPSSPVAFPDLCGLPRHVETIECPPRP